MADNKKPQVKEIVDRDGHQIAIYQSGAEYDITAGHLVRPPTHALITSENALQMRQRGIDLAMRAKVRAFAREAGVDPDTATDEELLAGYGNAQENIHRKAYNLFMEAKTPRQAEGLYQPLQRLPGETEKGSASVLIQNNVMGPEVAQAFAQIVSDVLAAKRAIDAQAQDVPEAKPKPFGGILQQGAEDA
jgi:hypothetical protein